MKVANLSEIATGMGASSVATVSGNIGPTVSRNMYNADGTMKNGVDYDNLLGGSKKKNKTTKEALVEAANKQPYVNAPVVLVFCMDPSRVNLKFPQDILDKFSLQDATLAAAYAQLAAAGLGLSSIWIGMLDEKKIQTILGTDLRPSSILCIGYPDKKRPPKSRRKLKELIEVIK